VIKPQKEILYVVHKVDGKQTAPYLSGEIVAQYVFSTRTAGREFARERNARSKRYRYIAPKRTVWGPSK
jgi:hypothetical protein